MKGILALIVTLNSAFRFKLSELFFKPFACGRRNIRWQYLNNIQAIARCPGEQFNCFSKSNTVLNNMKHQTYVLKSALFLSYIPALGHYPRF